MDKNKLKEIIKEEYHNVKSYMEEKYGFVPELGKVYSNPPANAFKNETYDGNLSDFKYDLTVALDNLGISAKAIKKVAKKGKGYEVRMSSYMKDKNTWERLGTDMGAELVDFKPGSVNVGLYESIDEASRGEIFKAAKKGNYPATVIVSQVRDMKMRVIKQVNVKTPAEVPATIKVLQKKYPKGDYKISLEDRTGKIIFRESINEGFKSEYEGNDNIIWKKGKTRHGVTNFTPYYKGHNIDKGGHNFRNEKELKDFIKDYILSNQLYNKYKYESVNERADYKYLTQTILDAKPKHNVYYNSGHNKVNIGGVGYDGGDLVKNFNQKSGSSSKIKNNFYYANEDPQKTKREVEKLSNGKIKVDIQKGYGGKPMPVYIMKESVNEGVFSTIDQIRQDSKDARDFIKNVFADPDFKDMKNDREFLKYLKSIYEGFSAVEEYDVENYQDVKEFVEFMREYKADINEAEYQGRDVKLGKIMQGDVKKFKVYVKNPKGNVVKVNFGHGGSSAKGKTMKIKKSNPERRKAFRARHNCDNPGPRHKARYWACRTW